MIFQDLKAESFGSNNIEEAHRLPLEQNVENGMTINDSPSNSTCEYLSYFVENNTSTNAAVTSGA